MDFDKVIRARKSVRKFSSKKPDWRDILEAVDAARYAPIAGGNYVCNFIVVSDKDKIQQLAKFADQDFIAKVNYVVVVCSNPGRLVNLYPDKGEVYARQQAGAAMENFILKIEEAGLSTCWIGHFYEEKVKKLLDIPGDSNVEAMFPIGFEFRKSKTRKAPVDMDRIVFFNEFGQEEMRD